MNMSPEEDYQGDVLQVKQIWEEMKETQCKPKKKAATKASTNNVTKVSQGTDKPKTSKTRLPTSPKNTRLEEQVVTVVTKPIVSYQNELHNDRNNQAKEVLLMPSLQGVQVSEVNELQRQLHEKDYELSLLRVTNSRNISRITQLQQEIEAKDVQIEELRQRQRELIQQTSSLASKQFNFDYGKVEYQNFKNDTRRLLKMLKTTNQYETFASIALEDDGVRFLHETNKKLKTKVDAVGAPRMHFCNCHKDFIPEAGFWVPEKVYTFAKQFLKDRKGDLTNSELELLLYELNRIWREREKRIVNTVKSKNK